MSDETPQRVTEVGEPARVTLPVSLAPDGRFAAAGEQLSLGPGSVLKQYELIRELGRGGMGRVFLARDTRLARLCAIKLLLGYSGERAERFLSEARATARCKHESIVVIYEVDEHGGFPYMVLEYVEGRTLRAWLEERAGDEPLPARGVAEMMIPVVQALVCAHEMGIVHRDLKPENIVLTEAGQIKVLDFGVAKQLVGDATRQALQPAERSLVGTPAYMSPEQWLDLDVDAQTDLWAVGIMLHELATGQHPLAPAGPAQLAAVRELDVALPLRTLAGPGAATLHGVVARCLCKRKAGRFASARALLVALEAVAGEQPASVGDDNPFAGLSAFQEQDVAQFFGRERDTAAVVGRLRQHPLVVVAGPSGAGK
ncbi:MAG TPA: serine/threonine-protein kinase, partial [Nannocystis sp.]